MDGARRIPMLESSCERFSTRHVLNSEDPMRVPFKLSLAKTATFAVVHFSVAFSIAYLLTGSIGIASAIALLEPMANTVAYLLHERAWNRFMPVQPMPVAAATVQQTE
jgi:uncharacterized membrane protein